MKDVTLAEMSFQLIRKDLGITESPDLHHSEDPIHELYQFLTRQIQYLLDHDFAHLINSLYRIDLPEGKVEKILKFSEPDKIASNLAKSVIERENQKIKTRMRYRL